MCAKDETELAATSMAGDPSAPERSWTSASAAIQEEARFARWFWRSCADQRASRYWLAWLLLLVVNAAFAGYLTSILGPSTGFAVLLLAQTGATLLTWPGLRRRFARGLARMRHKSLHSGQQIHPLADVEFYLSPSQDVLLISHKDGLAATALVAVDRVPVGIRGNMSAFVRAVYSAGVPLFYTLLHAPIPEQGLPNLRAISEEAQAHLTTMEPSQLASFAWRRGGIWKTRLLLGTRREASAIQNGFPEDVLEAQVRQDLQTLQIAFRTAYPHIRLRHLTGRELEDAVRSALLLGRPPSFF